MKRTNLIGSTALACMITTGAMATPVLQLDISGGTYDPLTETIVSEGTTFTLYALLTPGPNETMLNPYTLSMAVTPMTDESQDYGYFTMNGMQFDVTGDMQFGMPDALSPHGIFPTEYATLDFSFDAMKTVKTYNVQDNPGGPAALFDDGSKGTFYYAWEVDLSNIAEGTGIHFDLYGKVDDTRANKDAKAVFAPYSHDAEGSRTNVPEPTTISLLGLSLLSLGLIRKRALK